MAVRAKGSSVLPKTRRDKGESIRSGYRASPVTVLVVTDLAHLGALIADVARHLPRGDLAALLVGVRRRAFQTMPRCHP